MKNNTFILIFHILQLILNMQMLFWNLAVSFLPYLIQNFFFLTIFTHTLICFLNILTIACDISIIKNHHEINPKVFQGILLLHPSPLPCHHALLSFSFFISFSSFIFTSFSFFSSSSLPFLLPLFLLQIYSSFLFLFLFYRN